MDEKIRRDSRFFSRAVTRRNTVEMDRCVHSKCHCNAGITLTEVSRSFVPPPYIFVREKDARMPPNSSSILDRILRLVANMRSLLGNPMWQRNRSHRRLSSYVARTRSYNLLRSLNQGMKRHSKCNRRMIEGKFARIILLNQCGRFIKKIFNYSKVLNLSNSWLKSWKLSALWPRTSAEEKVR